MLNGIPSEETRMKSLYLKGWLNTVSILLVFGGMSLLSKRALGQG